MRAINEYKKPYEIPMSDALSDMRAVKNQPAPTAISDLVLWLDGADTSTMVSDASGYVSKWHDKSGNFNNAIQDTGANQPIIATGAGGNVCLDFQAGADCMILESLITTSAGYTRIFIGDTDNVAATRMFFADTTSTQKDGLITTGGGSYFTRPVSSSENTQLFPFVGTIGSIIATRDGSDKIDVYFDGGTANRLFADAAQSGDAKIDTIGGNRSTQAWNGRVQEIMIFNKTLTTAELNTIGNYIQDKYSITWTSIS